MFDTVVTHLRKQGKKSVGADELGNNMCLYRGPGGLNCAVGILIPDDQYYSYMESRGVSDLCNDYEMKASNKQQRLMAYLQEVHDGYNVALWEDHFESAATEFELDYAAPTP